MFPMLCVVRVGTWIISVGVPRTTRPRGSSGKRAGILNQQREAKGAEAEAARPCTITVARSCTRRKTTPEDCPEIDTIVPEDLTRPCIFYTTVHLLNSTVVSMKKKASREFRRV